ncbi:MAG: ribose 5-phosphate isomerase B [Alphaproteobacteria bacterium]|nr:ribose 5-phosphate isomerase B [Alphaproteobacteria bacterium]MBO7642456.1 ribose 5-phosphate isomerase B [Alphaproteobacteria bacterium]
MSIFIASDHAGFELKEYLQTQFNLLNLGTHNEESCDYPVFAKKLAIRLKNDDKGILICGTGIGMSIAANRFKNIRAALCFNEEMAKLARQHNDANILVLGARIISPETAKTCVEKFLSTDFEGGRHQRRLELIDI